MAPARDGFEFSTSALLFPGCAQCPRRFYVCRGACVAAVVSRVGSGRAGAVSLRAMVP